MRTIPTLLAAAVIAVAAVAAPANAAPLPDPCGGALGPPGSGVVEQCENAYRQSTAGQQQQAPAPQQQPPAQPVNAPPPVCTTARTR